MVGLKTEDASAFSTFIDLCAQQGLLKRRDGLTDEDVDDGLTDEGTLLRFLEAKGMDSAKALAQLEQATKFHTENNAVRLYDSISVADYENTRVLYPHWTGRCDREGRPIVMIDMTALDRAALEHWRATRDITPGPSANGDSIATPNMAQRAIVHFDGLTRFVLPLCSAAYGRPVTNCSYVVDASTLSLRQVWDVRDFARDISWLMATCYPETIHKAYICNVPFYFSKLYRILKPFIDPVTAEKLEFLQSSEAYPALSEIMDHDSIPINIGGAFRFTTGMLPDFDEQLRAALNLTGDLPRGPLKWVRDESGERKAVATGTVDGEERKQEVAVLRQQNGNGVAK
ncbi:CRAL-TRIO domain-containing protein [Aspergillus karnatakaensis]|uniref:SEC14 family lipid-binding protein n=1 Tax=Aspergillus karnatakaensis TaxID=1810916 RepID=UPI003CCCF2BC